MSDQTRGSCGTNPPTVSVTRAEVPASLVPTKAEMEPSTTNSREAEIRRAMLEIQGDNALTPKEKAQRMQVQRVRGLTVPYLRIYPRS